MITLTLLCTDLSVQVTESHGASLDGKQQIPRGPLTQSVNPVVQWNRTLLELCGRLARSRQPSIQPVALRSCTPQIYDAVNTIDRTHRPYLVQLTGVTRHASLAAAAAHEVVLMLYPKFQATFDVQFQQSLAQIADGDGKAEGINIGQTVADRILAQRSNDGSNVLVDSSRLREGSSTKG
jgi:hypothetical protein